MTRPRIVCSRPGCVETCLNACTHLCGDCHSEWVRDKSGAGWLLWIRDVTPKTPNPCCKQGCSAETTRQGIQLCFKCYDDLMHEPEGTNWPTWMTIPKYSRRQKSISVSRDMYKRIRAHTDQTGESIAGFITGLIEDHIDQEKREPVVHTIKPKGKMTTDEPI